MFQASSTVFCIAAGVCYERACCTSQVRQSDAYRVGAKAAMLGTLQAGGFPVPPGLCVTTAAFYRALETQQTRREYGVPAVFDTRNGSRRITAGVWVTVDGTAGTVELDSDPG